MADLTELSVVIDACSLYPMYLRDTLLRAAEARLYRVYWSEQILEELRRNLVCNGAMDEARALRLLQEMWRYFPDALVTDHERLIAEMSNHPKDRHVLAAAVQIGAQVIVTENLRDFPHQVVGKLGIAIQSSDAFLTHLYPLNPARMCRLVREQAAAYIRPPMSLEGLLTHLAQTADGFVTLLRQDLAS